jgi:hypothetical protein
MTKKLGHIKPAADHLAPALIDPPYCGSLQDWRAFRTEMLEAKRAGLPYASRFICDANREIERLRKS